jgi:hypothetical protein
MALKNAQQTLDLIDKAKPSEDLFILRGQDKTAPKMICLWIAENIETAPTWKLMEALECALRMRCNETGRKAAD